MSDKMFDILRKNYWSNRPVGMDLLWSAGHFTGHFTGHGPANQWEFGALVPLTPHSSHGSRYKERAPFSLSDLPHQSSPYTACTNKTHCSFCQTYMITAAKEAGTSMVKFFCGRQALSFRIVYPPFSTATPTHSSVCRNVHMPLISTYKTVQDKVSCTVHYQQTCMLFWQVPTLKDSVLITHKWNSPETKWLGLTKWLLPDKHLFRTTGRKTSAFRTF